MIARATGVGASVAALAACTSIPGTGWSRAPDLSVYGAMGLYGELAREDAMLCGGFSPASVERVWAEDFGARESTVSAAMIERYGSQAVAAAETAAVSRVPCADIPDLRWRHEYARLLRLLETRLALADGRGT